ncbi:hypothetical protein IGI04_024691, partial [Brassica rapa subsp. trilocularis]
MSEKNINTINNKYWHKTIWFNEHIPLNVFISRLILRRRLPNQGSLEALGVKCLRNVQTHYHLFFECSFSRLIWELFAPEVWISPPADLYFVAAWINQSRVNADAHATPVIKLYFQSAIYLLWKERNARVFTADSSPSSVILASFDRMM